MINIIFRKIAIKIATDKNLRDKLQTGVYKARELNSKGELLKTLGRVAGRLKSKVKH